MTRPRPMRSKPPSRASATTTPQAEWDEVAEASWESFPASDAPSWINQRDPTPDKDLAADVNGGDGGRASAPRRGTGKHRSRGRK